MVAPLFVVLNLITWYWWTPERTHPRTEFRGERENLKTSNRIIENRIKHTKHSRRSNSITKQKLIRITNQVSRACWSEMHQSGNSPCFEYLLICSRSTWTLSVDEDDHYQGNGNRRRRRVTTQKMHCYGGGGGCIWLSWPLGTKVTEQTYFSNGNVVLDDQQWVLFVLHIV